MNQDYLDLVHIGSTWPIWFPRRSEWRQRSDWGSKGQWRSSRLFSIAYGGRSPWWDAKSGPTFHVWQKFHADPNEVCLHSRESNQWYTTGFKRRQFLGGLHQNLVWPSCRGSFREQFLVLRMSQHPPIITENWSQFKSKLRFLNIFFLKPGLTKKFHFMKSFQFSLDGAVCFMPENFKTILKKIGAATSKSGLAMFFNIFLQNFWLNHFLSKNSSELSSQNWRFRA